MNIFIYSWLYSAWKWQVGAEICSGFAIIIKNIRKIQLQLTDPKKIVTNPFHLINKEVPSMILVTSTRFNDARMELWTRQWSKQAYPNWSDKKLISVYIIWNKSVYVLYEGSLNKIIIRTCQIGENMSHTQYCTATSCRTKLLKSNK
jgi:hypothetical protein